MIRIQGREVEFHYSPLAVAELEEKLDLSFQELYRRVQSGKGRLRDMLMVVWAGCLDQVPALDPETVSRVIQEEGLSLTDLFIEAFRQLLSEVRPILKSQTAGEDDPAKN